MLPTSQTTGDRGALLGNLFGERRVHFSNAEKKPHSMANVNCLI
jgi:hypothetical protein